MPIRKQAKSKQGIKKTMWDQAIADAEEKIKGLRFTLKVYRQKRDKGEPWPLDQRGSQLRG